MSLQKTLGIQSEGQGPEYGVDPLPIEKGPLDPLYKAWSALAAWPLSLGLMSTAFGLSVPLTLFVPLNRFQRLFPAPLMGMCLHTTLSKISVTYHPRFERERPSVFCMNHTSMLDAHVALKVIPQVFCGMMHAHHFSLPVYGWLMKKANGIGVSRSANGQFGAVSEQVRARAEQGIGVLTFPEGRRTQNGRILPFRLGVFRMAREAEMPVVPIAVRGLWQILRRGEWVVRPGALDVYVGPQIETAGLTDAELSTLAARMEAFTADYVERGELGDALAIDPRR